MNHHPDAIKTKTETDLAVLAPGSAHGPDAVEQAWFDEPRNRRSSAPPPPVEKVGEFLGDPLADNWLR